MVQWYLAGGTPSPFLMHTGPFGQGLFGRDGRDVEWSSGCWDSWAGVVEWSSGRVVVRGRGSPHPPTYSMVSRVLPGLELSDPHRATSPPAARQKARGPMICVCLIAVEYRVSTISEVVASRCLRRGSPVEVIESLRLRLAERPRDAIPGVGKSERSEIPHGLCGRRLPQEGLVLPGISRSGHHFKIR